MAELLGFLIVALLTLYVIQPLIHRGPSAEPQQRNAGLRDLSAERDTIYREIADLDFDHRLGKVSQEDYQLQRDDYLEQAAEVLLRLDRSVSNGHDQSSTEIPRGSSEIEAEILRLRRSRNES